MKKKSKTNIFTLIGLLLIAAALSITIWNIYSDRVAGETAEEALTQLREQIVEETEENEEVINETPIYEEYKEVEMPQIEIDGYKYIGILSIPTLGLELPIKGEFSYPALVGAPCRYLGSVYTDDLIIAGHNYPRHFGNLKNLKLGDTVTFTDADGNVFKYKTLEIIQLFGNDVEGMQNGEWDMTLFTCTLSGRQRVTVRLQRADAD